VESGNADASVLSTGFSEIDKAARRGVIKDNTADRYKARLAAASKRAAK
jgi:ribosomal protein S20